MNVNYLYTKTCDSLGICCAILQCLYLPGAVGGNIMEIIIKNNYMHLSAGS